jgi:hypothetical protein
VKRLISRREGAIGTLQLDAEAKQMGSRDRPHREAKKKPKDKSGAPKLQPLMDPPQNVELIRKERKPRRVEEEPEEG